MRPPRLVMLLLLLLILMAAPAGAQKGRQASGNTPESSGPEEYPRHFNSLTGLPYPDEAAMARRNLIVKISNYPPVVRPQAGLNQADLVYEVESENGITRFAAIYRSETPRHVGSVRSARLLDLELMTMYSAFLAYSGTSMQIQNIIWSTGRGPHVFSPLTGDNCLNAGFCRFGQMGVSYEHTLFVDTQQLYRAASARGDNYGYKARGLAFDVLPDVGGLPLREVGLQWFGEGNALWQYELVSGRWLRYTDGVSHHDALDGEQVWADNLIVLQVPHVSRPDLFVPGSDEESLEIQLWGSGPALVARDGRWYSAMWHRAGLTPTVALELRHTGSEKPVRLRPGRSWISVVRSLSHVTLSERLSEVLAAGSSRPERG